jgi:hypothetical protein
LQIWKLVQEEGVWCKFWALFEDRIPQWIRERFNTFGIKADTGTDLTLIELCGNDLRKIAREIEKLALVFNNRITPENVRFLVKKSVEASKYDIEDRFVVRDMAGTCLLIEDLKDQIQSRELLSTFVRYTRHACQAKFHIDSGEAFASQLAELAKHVHAMGTKRDWNSISKRNELITAAGALIGGVPMTTKMIWTGNLPLNKEEVVTEEVTAETVAKESDDSEDKKKKRKTKKDKLSNFDIDAEKKKRELEEKKKAGRELSMEISSHNVWSQKATLPLLKAFLMASHYTTPELSSMLLKLSTLMNEFGEEEWQRASLEVLLLEFRRSK